MITPRSILRRKVNILDKICIENQNTHFMFNKLSENSAVFGIQATDDNITRRIRIASWVTKATDTHLEYVLIIAFPR